MQLLKRVWFEMTTPIALVSAALGAFVFAVIGPFGTYNAAPFPMLLAFWMMIAVLALGLSLLCEKVVVNSGKVRGIGVPLVSGLIFCVLFTPLVLLARRVLWRDTFVGWEAIVQQFYWIASVTGPIVVLVYLIRTTVAVPVEAPITQDDGPMSRFLDGIEGASGAQLWWISADNHHLDVVTSRGTFRVRRRLGDAVRELDGAPGLRVHRSHWVTQAQIVGVHTAARRMVMRMQDGTEIPVGNSFRDDVAAVLKD